MSGNIPIFVISYVKSAYNNWYYVSLMPMDKLYMKSFQLKNYLFILGIKKMKPNTEYGKTYALGKGYEVLPVPTVEAMARNYANLQKLTIESYLQIITGKRDVDYFDEYVEAFMADGGEEMTNQLMAAWSAMK